MIEIWAYGREAIPELVKLIAFLESNDIKFKSLNSGFVPNYNCIYLFDEEPQNLNLIKVMFKLNKRNDSFYTLLKSNND